MADKRTAEETASSSPRFSLANFDPKWRTSVLLRKQLILLFSPDWFISIQDGGCSCDSTKTDFGVGKINTGVGVFVHS